MPKKRIHINQNWGVNEHTKFKMAASYCCNTTRHCKGIHSLFLSSLHPLSWYLSHTINTILYRKGKHIFPEPLEIQDGCPGSCMTIFTFTIVSFIETYHFRPTLILPDSWHISMIHNYWIANCWTMLYLKSSSSPSHCCIWRVWSLWQVLLPWHEPDMVHVRLLFLQPGLCDVHSCSLLFAGALDELQHFI